MKLFAMLSFLLLSIVATIACGSIGGNNPAHNAGSLSMTIQIPAPQSKHHTPSSGIVSDIKLPSGEYLNTIAYDLDDGTGNTYTGTVDVSGADPTVQVVGTSATFIVANVIPAPGYTVSISGATQDGSENCDGLSGTFTVLPETLTVEDLNVFCIATSTDGGAVQIGITATECPQWHWVQYGAWIPFNDMNGDCSGKDCSTTIVLDVTDIVVPTVTWSLPGAGAELGTQQLVTISGHEWLSEQQYDCAGYQGVANGVDFNISDANGNACPSSDNSGAITMLCP